MRTSSREDGHPTPPKVVDRLRRFLDAVNARKQEGKPAPEVRMQVVLFPKGTEVMLKLIDFAGEAGFHAINVVRLDVRGRPDLKRPTFEEERAMIAAARERAAKHGVPFGSVNDHGRILGSRLTTTPSASGSTISSTSTSPGSVAPCCLLRGHKLGNLVEQPLAEIWQSDRVQEVLRKGAPRAADKPSARRTSAGAKTLPSSGASSCSSSEWASPAAATHAAATGGGSRHVRRPHRRGHRG